MSPFLSFFATREVAHFFRSKFGDAAEVDVDVDVEVLVLGAGVLEVEDREELFVLLKLLEGVPPLDDRSSLRFSSLRCSSSLRERLLRQSRDPRSPYRLRSWSRSRLLPSDRELPLGGWAKARGVMPGKPAIVDQPNANISSRCKRGFILVSTLRAGRCFAARRFSVYCCHCNRSRPPLCGQRVTIQN